MHYPLIKQLESSDFRSTFAAAFGKGHVIFDNLSLCVGGPRLSYEALLNLIEPSLPGSLPGTVQLSPPTISPQTSNEVIIRIPVFF